MTQHLPINRSTRQFLIHLLEAAIRSSSPSVQRQALRTAVEYLGRKKTPEDDRQ